VFPHLLWLASTGTPRALANLIMINHHNLTRFERFNKVKALQVLLWTMATSFYVFPLSLNIAQQQCPTLVADID